MGRTSSKSANAGGEWCAEGLRFECTSCGACCTGPPGYVQFTGAEGKAIAKRLGVSLAAFRSTYTHDTPAGRSLAERKTEHGYDCVFLDRETIPGKATCSIYEDRPMQCKTWPWWPQNLGSREAWRRAARSCEGIGRGPLVPIEHIRIERNRTPSD